MDLKFQLNGVYVCWYQLSRDGVISGIAEMGSDCLLDTDHAAKLDNSLLSETCTHINSTVY